MNAKSVGCGFEKGVYGVKIECLTRNDGKQMIWRKRRRVKVEDRARVKLCGWMKR